MFGLSREREYEVRLLVMQDLVLLLLRATFPRSTLAALKEITDIDDLSKSGDSSRDPAERAADRFPEDLRTQVLQAYRTQSNSYFTEAMREKGPDWSEKIQEIWSILKK